MKYIFRYTILTGYTTNEDNIQERDLVANLKTANFKQIDQL